MFKRKTKKNSYFNKLSFSILGFILILLISIPLAKNLTKRYHVNKEINDLEEEITELEEKNMKLEELLTYLDSDEFIEEQARLKLGLKREGEEAIVVQGLDAGNTVNNELNYRIKGMDGKGKEEKNSKKWLNYFFKDQNLRLY